VNTATLPYWLAGGALWISEMHRTDMQHLLFGSPLLLLLCFRLWERWAGAAPRLAFRFVAVGTLVFALLNVAVAGLARQLVETRRGTIYTLKGDGALTFLQNHAAVGEEVFVYPYYPMYYFLTATRNAVRFSILVYHYNSKEQLEEVVRDVERKQVRYVLWDTVAAGENLTTWLPGYRHPPEDELIVEPYLRRHYEMVGFANGFRLMRRRGLPGG
jgi:hypothetical protein